MLWVHRAGSSHQVRLKEAGLRQVSVKEEWALCREQHVQNLRGMKYQGTFRKHQVNSGCLESGLSPEYPEGPLKNFNRGTIRVGMPRIQNVEEVEKKWLGSKAFPQ